MRNFIRTFLTLSFTAYLTAAPAAKGPGSGLSNVSAIRVTESISADDGLQSVKSVPELRLEEVPEFTQDSDGTKFVLFRYQSEGAEAVRAHLRSVRLSPGMRLFIYGIDKDGAATVVHGPYEGSGPMESGEFWSPGVSGDQLVIEFQVDGDTPADLPFEVDRMDDKASAYIQDSNTGEAFSREVLRTSRYRGLELTHLVDQGLAIYENDILLGPADELDRAEANSSKKKGREGVGVSLTQYLWPNRTMPYVIDPSLPDPSRVQSAVDAWNVALNGAVRLVPRTTQSTYAVFYPAANAYQCYSPVGYSGAGAQYTYLGGACARGNVIHEIGHQLGLWHEHTRADRNSHVTVQFQNIDPSAYSNFSQNVWNSADLGSYDYNSIMHYGPYSFSINGQPTITTIPAGIPIGQRDNLSSGDVAAVIKLYGGTVAPPAVQVVSVTISANPAGAQVTVDGSTVAAPITYQWTAGSIHTIAAANQYTAAGTYAGFSYWSDGGGAAHTITASASQPTITANFQMQYQLTTAVTGIGSVTLSSQGSGGYYPAGSVITLTAVPGSGYCFSSWTGLLSGTSSQISLTLTRAMSVTANFTSCAPVVTTYVPSFSPIRVNAGGAAYWDSSGKFWSGDYGYTPSNTYGVSTAIANTPTAVLYQSERWASGTTLQYGFNVPNGTYNVTLKFAEIFFYSPGQRVFHIAINGQTYVWNFDPQAAAGGSFRAVDRTFTITTSNGRIDISLIPVIENPKISAIEITQ